MEGLIADVDDIVTCPRGHPIYRVTGRVERASLVRADTFEPLCPRLVVPQRSDQLARCPRCGLPWWRQHPLRVGMQLHLEDGWHP